MRRSPSKAFWRGALGIAVVLAVWEGFAHSGLFSTALTPPLERIARVLGRMLIDGTLAENAVYTLARMFFGLGLSFAVALPLGVAMARSMVAERIVMPVLSVLLPIPSLAWVPLFVLWFGIGDATTIVVVIYASFIPLTLNIWTGVRAVNPLWLRAAMVMGADRGFLLRKVVWPGALPYVITGLRLGFGRAWIGVIGGELLASPRYGLGQIIFDAKEYLEAGTMLATLVVIGLLGILFERFVFQTIETATIRKWGMVAGSSP
jgi:NitT/TauT family transport system permease protein